MRGPALPPGITLSSSGLIQGTPSTSGSFPFTVAIDDALGCTGSQAFQIDVCSPLTVAPATLPRRW